MHTNTVSKSRFCISLGTVAVTLISILTATPTPASAAGNPACVSSNSSSGLTYTQEFTLGSNPSTCDWTVPAGVSSAEIMVVGAGGAGGGYHATQPLRAGGGGGAGEVLYKQSLPLQSGAVIPITIGSGPWSQANPGRGLSGGDTTFDYPTNPAVAKGGSGGGSGSQFDSDGGASLASGSTGGGGRFRFSSTETQTNESTFYTSYKNHGGVGSGIENTSNWNGENESFGAGGGGGGAGGAGGDASFTVIWGRNRFVGVTSGAGGLGISLMNRCVASGGSGRAASRYGTDGYDIDRSSSIYTTYQGRWAVQPVNSTANGCTGSGANMGANSGSGGNSSQVSNKAGNGLVVLRFQIEAPQITSSQSSALVKPTISGTGTAGSKVTVNAGGATFTNIPVNVSGNWSLNTAKVKPSTGTFTLAVGSNSISAKTIVVAGSTMESALTTSTITLNPTIPLAATHAGLLNESNSGSYGDSLTSDNTPGVGVSFSDTYEEGSTFTIRATKSGVVRSCTEERSESSSCVLPELADGTWSLSAFQTNLVGTNSAVGIFGTIIIDTLSPAQPTSFNMVTDNGLNSADRIASGYTHSFRVANVQVTDTVQIVSFQGLETGPSCVAVGSINVLCALTFPNSGAWNVSATVTDAAGNVSSPSSFFVNLDNNVSAPSISNTATSLNLTTVTVNFSGEPNAIFKCQTDGGAFSNCTSPRQVSVVGQGIHTFTVYQIDLAGNTSETNSYTFSVDSIAPSLSINPLPAGTRYGSNITIDFNAEPGSTLSCQLDSQPASACTGSNRIVYTDLASGDHVFRITATDSAGNSRVASINWTQNSSGISSPTINAQNAWSNVNSRTLYFNSDPTATSNLCSIDGGEFFTCTSPITTGLLSDGAHSLRVKSLGQDVYVSGTDTYNWIQDTIAPAIPTLPESGTLLNSRPLTINFSADTQTRLTCQIDSGPQGECTTTASMVLQFPAQGSHQLTVRSTDSADNSSSATYSWNYDSVAPNRPLASGWTFSSSSVGRSIAFSVAEDVVSTKCSLNGSPFETCESPFVTGALPDGNHVFKVQAFDGHGNGSIVSSYSWAQLIASPQAPAITTRDAILISSSPRIYFTVATGHTATCSLDDGPSTTCGANGYVNYWGLSEGSHTLVVTATNGVGSSASSSYSWTQDSLAPSAPALEATDPYSRTSSRSLSFTHALDAWETQCSLDGAPFAACTSPLALSALGEGSHTLRMKSIDYAGHVSPLTAYVWVQDTVVPNTPVISNQSSVVASNQLVINFTGDGTIFKCAVDLGTWETCISGLTVTVGADGPHNLLIKSVDAAGNESPAASFDWTVDTIAPTAPMPDQESVNPSGLTASQTATLFFTENQNISYECRLLVDWVVVNEWAACTSGIELRNLTDGSHDFEVRAIDAAGNRSGSMHTTWEVLSAIPMAPIGDPLNPMVNGSTSQLAWFYMYFKLQPGLTAECRILRNDVVVTNWEPCESGDQIQTVEGEYDLYIRSVNAVNTVSPVLHYNWIVDFPDVEDPSNSNRPTITNDGGLITLSGANTTNGFRYQYRAIAEDNEVLIPWTSTPSSFGLRLSSGRYVVESRMIDGANGTGQPSSAFITITEQQPAPRSGSVPNVRIDTSSVAGYTRQVVFPVTIDWPVGTTSIRLSSTDNASSPESTKVLQLMAESENQPGSRVVNWSFTPTGALPQSTKLHNLTVQFLDAAGSVISSASDSVIIDTVAPNFGRIQVTNYVNGTLYVKVSATEELLGSGVTTGFVARSQNEMPISFNLSTGTFAIPNVSVGDTFLMAVSDRVGNVSTPLSLNVLNFESSTTSTVVAGVPLVGKTLSLKSTGFSASRKVSYQWFADGVAIPGATKTSFTLTNAQAGKVITATATGARAGYFPIYSDSNGTVRVAGGKLSVGNPSISGSATVGGTLTAVPGVWSLTPDFLYEWKIDNVVVSTLQSFTPANAHAGKKATLKVTAVKNGFADLSKTVTSAMITGGTLVPGSAAFTDSFVGATRTLTATTSDWAQAGVGFTYQWLRNGVVIPKATARTYTLLAADFGQTISVRVTAAVAGFTPVQVTSAGNIIALGTITAGTVATTTKVSKGKRTYTATTTAWTPAPITLTYQWLRNGTPIAKATGASYTAVAADKGANLSVRVAGSRLGFISATATSATTFVP